MTLNPVPTALAITPVEPTRIDPRIALVELSPDVLAWADCVVVVTDHDCFDWNLVKQQAKFVFDTRRRLSGSNVEHL